MHSFRSVARRLRWLTGLLAAAALTACAGAPSDATTNPSAAKAASPSVMTPSNVVVSTEAWTYAGKPGRAIHTRSYRFYLTANEPVLVGRLPLFMETALTHYRAAFGGLPEPPGKLETFLMGTRGQWELLTKQLMGESAETYLRIQRGGFASGGRGVFYDIGVADTLSIAGHEGWHQYTQRTFREALPIWLEEGIATTMEGYRWDGTSPTMLPWSNTERFDQLRSASSKGILMPLADIFETSPQELLAPQSSADVKPGQGGRRPIDRALTYYAQIWILVHFLREGEDGKYRGALNQAVNDAALGTLTRTMAAKMGDRPARSAAMTRKGPVLAMSYFNENLDELAQEYASFVQAVVKPGGRGAVVEGRSPVRTR